MPEPTCPTHPHVPLRCPACAGAKGGAKASPKQQTASKRNGRRGGRPKSGTRDLERPQPVP